MIEAGTGGMPVTQDGRLSTGVGPRPVPTDRLSRALHDHHALVWRSLRRFGVRPDMVNDAAQYVFLIFAGRLAAVPLSKERSFLLATAVRVAANERRRGVRAQEVPTDDVDRSANTDANPEELLERKERRRQLDQMLDGLPLQQRSVFVLFELEGFSLPEIAESLGIPLGTATSRLRRARLRFETLVSTQLAITGDR